MRRARQAKNPLHCAPSHQGRGAIRLIERLLDIGARELGIKGVGEAGAIPVGALFAQAIEDALGLPAQGVELLEIPLSPSRLWELIEAGRASGA